MAWLVVRCLVHAAVLRYRVSACLDRNLRRNEDLLEDLSLSPSQPFRQNNVPGQHA